MSTDIDMKVFAGAVPSQAAADQQIASNTYQDAFSEDYPVIKEFLEPPARPESAPQADPTAAIPEPTPSPQELNFRALTEEVESIKRARDADRKDYDLQIQLLKANSSRPDPTPVPAPSERKMFDGMADSDVPNVSEFRREWEARENTYKARLEELEVAAQHSDYAEVLNKYVAPLLKEKPILAQGIYSAQNKAQYAYELGKLAQQIQQSQSQTPPPQVAATAPPLSQKVTDAQRIVENARKPGTLANAAGTGALSQAEYFSTMSDAEFAKFASKNLGEI